MNETREAELWRAAIESAPDLALRRTWLDSVQGSVLYRLAFTELVSVRSECPDRLRYDYEARIEAERVNDARSDAGPLLVL